MSVGMGQATPGPTQENIEVRMEADIHHIFERLDAIRRELEQEATFLKQRLVNIENQMVTIKKVFRALEQTDPVNPETLDALRERETEYGPP